MRISCRWLSKLLVGSLAGSLFLSAGGCLDQEAVSSLVDLAASTSGSLVQIFVKAGLTNAATNQDPDLSLPISEQEH